MNTNSLREFYPDLDLESESVAQSSYYLTRLASIWGEDFLEPDEEERENSENIAFCCLKIEIAKRVCHLIPVSCPLARDILLFGQTLQIPLLCKLNPLYKYLMAFQFSDRSTQLSLDSSLSHLAQLLAAFFQGDNYASISRGSSPRTS
jgi:hypothetical protein